MSRRSLKYFLSLFLTIVTFLTFFAILPFLTLLPPVYAQPEASMEIVPPTQIEGYAQSLKVGGGDLIALVVKITNYVLGFLGITAITAIIYAGILYVANFGNEEMTTKAKNIITWVAIGVVIILLSYAIVNALVGVVNRGSIGSTGPGRINQGDRPVTQIDPLGGAEDKDYLSPLILSLQELGDLCPGTPLGLAVNTFGCASNQIIADTDADGTANLLDPDDDNDGKPDSTDSDQDGDKVCGIGKQANPPECSIGNDQCPDTLNFLAFKAKRIEAQKVQPDKPSRAEYEQYIIDHEGCAEYQRKSNIDGDLCDSEDDQCQPLNQLGGPCIDQQDCDADADGFLDNQECLIGFEQKFPVGAQNFGSLNPPKFRCAAALTIDGAPAIIRGEIDADTDNDGVADVGRRFKTPGAGLIPGTSSGPGGSSGGGGLSGGGTGGGNTGGGSTGGGSTGGGATGGSGPVTEEDRQQIIRQIENNFILLENFIRISCATLPQTKRVLEYCGYDSAGNPTGKLVRLLKNMGSKLTPEQFQEFNIVYQEFLNVFRTFKRVEANVKTANNRFDDSLSVDEQKVTMSFDATTTKDPYQEFCSVNPNNYFWFVNKNLDFSQGLTNLLATTTPNGTGVFYNHTFTDQGIFNVQLIVKSACKFNVVNPGAGESADVDAAVAGLASARINIFPPAARIIALINGQPDPGSQPVKVLSRITEPVRFDLRTSVTSRGQFKSLTYNCGNNIPDTTINGGTSGWQFTCDYREGLSGERTVLLRAADGQGMIERRIRLILSDILPILNVQPGLTGTTSTNFLFDATSSQPASQIKNYTILIKDKNGTEVKKFQQASATHRFAAPGEYTVTLEVVLGGGANQAASTQVTITVETQAPVGAFRITFPELIRPARGRFDGSLSFHPDFPQGTALQFVWETDGVVLSLKSGTNTGPFTYEQVDAGSDAKIFYEFQSVGDHLVTLTVKKDDKSNRLSEKVNIKSLLGVDMTIDKPGARINELITFTPLSDKALGFFWDFGDQVTQIGSRQPVVHKYDRQGRYKVKLEVEDGANNKNSVEKIVRIGTQDKPMAVAQVFVNNVEQNFLEAEDCVEVSRRDTVIFDAGKSLNVKGDTAGLSFFWEIEDSEDILRTKSFSRVFKDLTEGCFEVRLKVTEETTKAIATTDPIPIKVVNHKPELTEIRYLIDGLKTVTPFAVTLSAVGPKDFDGRVAKYYWWYYEAGQKEKPLDAHITDGPRTTFIIPPRRVEGTESTYFFAVEITDDEGATFSSEALKTDSVPLVVTNGPNIAPIAEFVVDRSQVGVGERMTFTSTTKDPLGEFIPSSAYQWDMEGKGEFDRGITGPKITHQYQTPGEYLVTLKVTKNGLSSLYSIRVKIVATSKKPEAAFIYLQTGSRVKFISNSSVDPALPKKDLALLWDFDTLSDSDGNGVTDDDLDSTEISPTFEYKGDKDIFAQLRVIDSVGNSAKVIRKIPFLLPDATVGALGSARVIKLKPILTVNPAPDALDGKVYLPGSASDVIFNSKKSTGAIQEYRLDTNIFVDGDSDGIADNDIDNKAHKSWKDGSAFKAQYRKTEEKIRAKLTVVDNKGLQKSQVMDIVFGEKPKEDIRPQTPDEVAALFQKVMVVSFDSESPFGEPKKPLSFDASKTRFPDEKVKEYRWDFDGDGLVDEISFTPTFTYTYQKAGTYEVILEAVSEGGLQGEYSQTLFIRGDLELPKADFSVEKKANELMLKNTSTVDPSFKEEEIRFEWTFSKADVSGAASFESYEKIPEITFSEPLFDAPPAWVTKTMTLAASELAPGLISREIVLGESDVFARFKAGTTLADLANTPFLGEIHMTLGENKAISLPDGKPLAFGIETGVKEALVSSDQVEIIVKGVVLEPRLYQLTDSGTPTVLSEGKVENNLTVFTLGNFGGRYAISGTREVSGKKDQEVIGVSPTKDPIKVFDTEGVYEVKLTVTDGVGEKSEKKEIVTIEKAALEKEPVKKETLPVEESFIPIPELTVPEEEEGGISFFFVVLVGFIVFAVGGVVIIVMKTIRSRQTELEAAAPRSKAMAPEIVKAEVVEAKAKPSPPSSPPPPLPLPPSPPPLSKVPPSSPPAKPAPTAAPKNEAAKPPDTKGPIPDWLKG